MKIITVNDLKNIIMEENKKSYIIEIEGLISTKVQINKCEILLNNDNVILFDEAKNKLSINRHQIVRINIDANNIITIDLDQFLKIYIINQKDIP